MLIFNHVTSALRFLRDLDRRVQRHEQGEAEKEDQIQQDKDALPF